MSPSEVSSSKFIDLKNALHNFKNIRTLQNQVKNKGDQHILHSSSKNTIKLQHSNIDHYYCKWVTAPAGVNIQLIYIACLNQWDNSSYLTGFLLEDNNVSAFPVYR